jgi:hypothetical protein
MQVSNTDNQGISVMSLLPSTIFSNMWIVVTSDDESKDTNSRQVVRKLKSGQYDRFFAGDVYRSTSAPGASPPTSNLS